MLQNCIHSIKAYTDMPYEIIVVDNGSNDGSCEFCYQEKVKLISFAFNLGFPVACNAGLRIATGDALLLLNNDTIVTPQWLNMMTNCLFSTENIGIVGPMTNFASGRQKIPEPFTTVEEMLQTYNNNPDPAKWSEVTRLVGFCFLFKRELLDMIGFLDETYSPGHYEDDDYCYRARLAGYRLMIAGDVFVYHHGNASFDRERLHDIEQLLAVNRKKFMEKWNVDPSAFM